MNTKSSLTVILFLLFLCQGLQAQSKKEERFNFPPDFGKAETIVLIAGLPDDKTTKSMVNAFEKHYTGKFATMSSLTVEEMLNTKKYRYIFNYLGHVSGRDFAPVYKFGLKDQKTGKDYPTDFWSGSHKKGANYYVENLEKFRKKNSGL